MDTAGVCAVRRQMFIFEQIMIFYFFVRARVTFSLLNGMGEVCPALIDSSLLQWLIHCWHLLMESNSSGADG